MEGKDKAVAVWKIGLIAISLMLVITATIIMIVLVSNTMQKDKVDVSNSKAEEFYLQETETEPESEQIAESAEETTSVATTEESTQSPSEIAATQEIKPEDLIGNGLSAEEWDYIYEQAGRNAPDAVEPFTIVELSNRFIKLYDGNGNYFEWVPN